MKYSIQAHLYAATLLLSAALLFSVQPLFSKMILPLLGGSPQVWTTSMLFFQIFLLAGYAWAHFTARLAVKTQAVMQAIIFTFFLIILPLSIPAGWMPRADQNPMYWQIMVMTLRIGGPFFVLSALAPMLQHWFSKTGHPQADNPYTLYAASNLGSMTALLSYPLIIEPVLDLPAQSFAWFCGYVALLGLVVICARQAWHVPKESARNKFLPSSWRLRAQWLLYAFVPSSLMLGVTAYITTDVASVPLLWVVPLALYVGTFILSFAQRQFIALKNLWYWQGIALVAVLIAPLAFSSWIGSNIAIMLALHLVLFFLTALACHMRLVNLKPQAGNLTEFYLFMSLGGALGGLFNAIIAPIIFSMPLEYPILLAVAAFLRFVPQNAPGEALSNIKNHFKAHKFDGIFNFYTVGFFIILFFAVLAHAHAQTNYYYISAAVITATMAFFLKDRWGFGLMICILLIIFTPGYALRNDNFKNILLRERNFFGVLKVVDSKDGERFLLHGTTNHGAQALDKKHALTPIAYYGADSPVHDPFQILDRRRGNQNIAVIGLGVGVTACLNKSARHFDFFEIDPDVVKIAEDKNLFTYLSDCGSPYDIILGDGRLGMKAQADKKYDLIFVDVYSSDNIPVHMITREAVTIYLSKLKKDGILIFNISNKFLDIEPVLTNIAADLQVPGYAHTSEGGAVPGTKIKYYPAHYFAMSPDKAVIKSLSDQGWTKGMSREGVGIWTDRYSNIIGVLGNKIAIERGRDASKK